MQGLLTDIAIGLEERTIEYLKVEKVLFSVLGQISQALMISRLLRSGKVSACGG